MKYKELLFNKIQQLIQDNKVKLDLTIEEKLRELLDACPDDDLLLQALPKWNKRSETIELCWNFDDSYHATYVLGKQKMSWNVVFLNERFTHEKEGVNAFFASILKCDEKYKYWNEVLCDKVLSKTEFCHLLKEEFQSYISHVVSGNMGEYDKAVLGIDKKSLRPIIEKEKELEGCEIIEIKDYVNFELLKSNLHRYKFCTDKVYEEIIDKDFLQVLAGRYFPNDDVDKIKLIVKDKKWFRISKNKFYELFNQCMHHYLVERTESKIYGFEKKKYKLKKYLGVDVLTLKPYISIIEGLVGCDVYDLDKITECYQKDNKGKFQFKKSENEFYGKAIIKDNNLIKALVDYYFGDEPRSLKIELPIVKHAQDYQLNQSEYVQIYKDEWSDALNNKSIAGKFSDYLWYDRYIEVPKNLLAIFKQYIDDKGKQDKDFESADIYSRKAIKYKREKNYVEAIKWYLKCKKLLPNVNIGTARGMFHELLICYRMVKDTHNRALIAKEAHDYFPEEIEFEKAYLETSFQLPVDILSSKPFEVKDAVNYGELYEKEIRLLPEYTFSDKNSPFHKYSKRSKSYEWDVSIRKFYKIIAGPKKIQDHFWELIRKGQDSEKLGNIDEAVASYELLLAEGCYRTTPIDRLIVLYSKQGRKEDLKRVLVKSIDHFKQLEKRQLDYVTSLAEKHNAVKELKEQLKQREEVRYWGGDIVLYQKYKKVESWEKRLSKLK